MKYYVVAIYDSRQEYFGIYLKEVEAYDEESAISDVMFSFMEEHIRTETKRPDKRFKVNVIEI